MESYIKELHQALLSKAEMQCLHVLREHAAQPSKLKRELVAVRTELGDEKGVDLWSKVLPLVQQEAMKSISWKRGAPGAN